jgi:hypothetical protein
MTHKRYFLILLLILSLTTPFLAQLGGGVRFGGNYYLAKKDYKILFFGGFLSYTLDETQSFRLGMMYGVPYNLSFTHEAYATDASIQPRTSEVIQNTTLKNFSIFAEYQKYFTDFSDSKVGVYANVGFAFLSSSAISTFENTSVNYTIPEFEMITDVEKYSQLMIRASMGLEVRISVMKWFLEAGIGMPGSTNEKKQVNLAYLPGYLELATGIRF